MKQRFNLFEGNTETLAICETHNLASINRGPLAMGLLTGKFDEHSKLPEDDVRHSWNFQNGEQAQRLQKLAELRSVLTSDGRTLAQAALGWNGRAVQPACPFQGLKASNKSKKTWVRCTMAR